MRRAGISLAPYIRPMARSSPARFTGSRADLAQEPGRAGCGFQMQDREGKPGEERIPGRVAGPGKGTRVT
jgi:hypothetical protein